MYQENGTYRTQTEEVIIKRQKKTKKSLRDTTQRERHSKQTPGERKSNMRKREQEKSCKLQHGQYNNNGDNGQI